MAARLTAEQRCLARRLRGQGWPLRRIAAQVGGSHEAVRLVERDGRVGTGRPGEWSLGPRRLTLAEREEISLGLERAETFTTIAMRVGRVVSSVSREVAANGGRDGYRAWRAHQRARERTRRPKTPKLAGRRLAHQVEVWLRECVVAPRDRSPRADRVPGRSDDVPRDHLRAKRRLPGRTQRRGQLPGMVMISDRPAEIADRAVPGPLGRRPDRRQRTALRGRDARGALDALHLMKPSERLAELLAHTG